MDPAHPYRLVAVGRRGTAYLSGVLPYRDDGTLASGSAESIACALATLDGRLADAGLHRGDVVKATVYVTDIGWLGALNEQWSAHFAASLPARTTVEVRALPRGAGIEIDAIAEVGGVAGHPA